MITFKMKNKEVEIELTYRHRIGEKPSIKIVGDADLPHHLIEGAFEAVERLAKMEDVCHRAEEYKEKRGRDDRCSG